MCDVIDSQICTLSLSYDLLLCAAIVADRSRRGQRKSARSRPLVCCRRVVNCWNVCRVSA